jgi:DoxX-like family
MLNVALWVIQALLAAVYLFSGGIKFVMPVAEMQAQMPVLLPGWFLHFIGTCEVLGALGLILPGLLRIRPGLTPLAAAGLVIIMVGAVILTLMGMGVLPALLPLAVGILDAFVAFGRWRLAPLRGSVRPGLLGRP